MQVHPLAWKAKQTAAKLHSEHRHFGTTGWHRKDHSMPRFVRHSLLLPLQSPCSFDRHREGHSGTAHPDVHQVRGGSRNSGDDDFTQGHHETGHRLLRWRHARRISSFHGTGQGRLWPDRRHRIVVESPTCCSNTMLVFLIQLFIRINFGRSPV